MRSGAVGDRQSRSQAFELERLVGVRWAGPDAIAANPRCPRVGRCRDGFTLARRSPPLRQFDGDVGGDRQLELLGVLELDVDRERGEPWLAVLGRPRLVVEVGERALFAAVRAHRQRQRRPHEAPAADAEPAAADEHVTVIVECDAFDFERDSIRAGGLMIGSLASHRC